MSTEPNQPKTILANLLRVFSFGIISKTVFEQNFHVNITGGDGSAISITADQIVSPNSIWKYGFKYTDDPAQNVVNSLIASRV